MLKHSIKFLIATISLYNFSIYAGCSTAYIPHEQKLNYSRENFNYEDEGRLLFKLRFSGVRASDKIKGLPAPTTPSNERVSSILKNGIGGEASTTFFVADKIAIELGAGCLYFRKHSKPIEAIFNNYSGYNIKKGPTYMIPINAIAQYHIAPYGGIQPYLGAGLHGAYVIPKAKGITIKNHYGPVLQAGIDLVFKDLTLINFDIKQYIANPKIIMNMPLLTNKISGKVRTNPLVVSVGFGFRF